MARRFFRAAALLLALVASSGCAVGTIFGRNLAVLGHSPKAVPNKIKDPVRRDARIAVLWVGHATALVQIDDKFILTDPVFTQTVGQLSRRLVEPGIEVANLPPIDLVLISHMHFDHLSVGSLDLLEPKVKQLLVPQGGLVYVPNYRFPTDEIARWKSVDVAGLRVTAVPVRHHAFRYGADVAWLTTTFTGWVVEYHGKTVYFGGDTAYDRDNFVSTAARFPNIDVALIPIAPVHPREMMRRSHVDPPEALQAFVDLGAKHMVPIHYDTFENSLDAPGEALQILRDTMAARGIGSEGVHILPIGGQLAIP